MMAKTPRRDAASSSPGPPHQPGSVGASRAGRPAMSGEPSAAEANWTADQAVVHLYGLHYRRLVRLAALLLCDQSAAEDVVQDAFVALHTKWSTLRDPRTADAYLRVSVVNGSRTAQRRRLAEKIKAAAEAARSSRSVTGHPAFGSADSMSGTHDRNEVFAALADLPRRQREVLVLRYFGDLSEAMIAETLNISRGSVKTHTSRGLAALRRTLSGPESGAR